MAAVQGNFFYHRVLMNDFFKPLFFCKLMIENMNTFERFVPRCDVLKSLLRAVAVVDPDL